MQESTAWGGPAAGSPPEGACSSGPRDTRAATVQIVAAVPMSTQGLPWVKAGRSWRRGIRTAFVTDFYPSADMILDGGTHGETFVFLNTSNIPYRYYGKAGGCGQGARRRVHAPRRLGRTRARHGGGSWLPALQQPRATRARPAQLWCPPQ